MQFAICQEDRICNMKVIKDEFHILFTCPTYVNI